MTSYFSAPQDHLDPALFDGMTLKEDVRRPLIDAARTTLRKATMKMPETWMNIWLTGSGITYQWTDNHDLDVQFGIRYDTFLLWNPDYQYVSQWDMEARLNSYLKTFLWPKMEHAVFNGKEFTVTYFWNSGVEDDITIIHPYAAYDVCMNQWITEPPQIPPDPKTLYPKAWFDQAQDDEFSSARIASVYEDAAKELPSYTPGSGNYINAKTRMNLARAQAQTLFDDIHIGRRQAFAEGGKGYYDYNNFRWQQAKQAGTTDRLMSIIHAARQAKAAEETALYGKPISSAQDAIDDAMNFRLGTRYDS